MKKITSELKEKINLEIGTYLSKELQKYPDASKKIRHPLKRGVPAINPQLIPVLETLIIIIQTVFLMVHGRLIIEHWRHIKTINELNSVLESAAKETTTNVDKIKIISDRINILSNMLNNFALPDKAKNDITVDLFKKTADIVADYDILSEEEDLNMVRSHETNKK